MTNTTVPMRLLAAAAAVTLGVLVASAGAVQAEPDPGEELAPPPGAAPAAQFSQCPAIGLDTGCAILIVINADGSISVQTDPAQPPYEGDEDSLIGVQNNTSISVPSLQLTGSSDPPAFEFDGDGLCTITDPPGNPQPGCPFGPSGYEGPGTSFTNVSADFQTGTVVFAGGLAPGGSAYFSLEGPITAEGLDIPPIDVPEEEPAPAPAAAPAVVGPTFTG